jgi:hypothetical protein
MHKILQLSITWMARAVCLRAQCCGWLCRLCGRRSDPTALSAKWEAAAAQAEQNALGQEYKGVVNDADDDGGYGSEDSEAMGELLVHADRQRRAARHASRSTRGYGAADADMRGQSTGAQQLEAQLAGEAAAREVLLWAGVALADIETVADIATADFLTPQARSVYGQDQD